jgi:phosphonate transport system substrate-binding protein
MGEAVAKEKRNVARGKGKKFISLLFLSLLGLTGCGDNDPAKKIDLSVREKITVEDVQPAITYAYAPQYSHTVSYQRHHLLVEYLTRATGLRIRQVYPDTFDEHMNMVGRGLIDISFVNPFIYVKIADRYGAMAFARVAESSGELNFRGQVICRADNPHIQNLADLKGKRWIAVDPSSAGGYLYHWGLFLENGLSREDFAEIAFAPGPGGKQEKVVMAVYSGKYDFGTVREGTMNLLASKIDLKQIRVLAHTPWYPGWLYVARQGLDRDVVEKIKQALLALNMNNPADAAILQKAGFNAALPLGEVNFEAVRRLVPMAESIDPSN